MHITIFAIGRLKDPPLAQLISRYSTWCGWPIDFVEIQPKEKQRSLSGERQLIEARLPKKYPFVAMAEEGLSLSSQKFAQTLLDAQTGWSGISFVIGGADGLDPELKANAWKVLSLGRLTMPHMLARLVLTEQIYRANCILSGHPYHRD